MDSAEREALAAWDDILLVPKTIESAAAAGDKMSPGQRQGTQMKALFREGLDDDALRCGVHARIGNDIQPLPQLSVKIIKVAKRARQEEVFTNIAEAVFAGAQEKLPSCSVAPYPNKSD